MCKSKLSQSISKFTLKVYYVVSEKVLKAKGKKTTD